MLYFLSRFSAEFGPLRLFEYVTFRAGGAAITAFLLTVLLGGATARLLKSLHAQAADRFEGLIAPELIDKAKNKTPCMGGADHDPLHHLEHDSPRQRHHLDHECGKTKLS